ncbi:RnfH family protein [Pigmentiphaga sp.]|uniref:RnfH family protein n=1 Tax=Pigmentiphaga sp. TaxID=1977564 RepID=UPI00128CA393|nr:RnfH family protein [Pigmentiphaga sp.]MPS26199.1 RnfH family protein [Alcaligenaceae bacterium SAGV5]MPS53293.1 RnfH family protein [Alcaligenaceae bacterium SAGV3]MPT57771.1 RnfH family protein [Alcaligenaceae bacterium]
MDSPAGPGGGAADTVAISVCYVDASEPWIRELALPRGATLADAIEASGFRQAHPGVDPGQAGTGVHGRRRPLDHVLHDHDRVEIYRPLVFDPKESRRRRAAHKAASAGAKARGRVR